MKKPIYIIAILILVLCSAKLSADFNFAGYPYGAYSLETKLMLGAFAFVQNTEDPELSLLTNTIYTQNHQFLVVLVPEYYEPKTQIKFSSEAYLKLWPDTFYGIGNFTDKDVQEPYTSEIYVNNITISRQVYTNIFVSFKAGQGYHSIRKSVSDGLLQSSDLLGKENSFFSGIGYSLSYDTTDNPNYPTRGVRYNFQHVFYREEFLSDLNYVEHRYDLRNFISLTPKIVLASQTDLAFNTGEVPFYSYLELGNRLRAYDSKRYIDKARIAQRLEQRVFPFDEGFYKRVGFVVFGEAGQVASSYEKIRLTDWHWSTGFGFRFSILPDERLNLRMDIGFGDDSFNFIVNAREVF